MDWKAFIVWLACVDTEHIINQMWKLIEWYSNASMLQLRLFYVTKILPYIGA